MQTYQSQPALQQSRRGAQAFAQGERSTKSARSMVLEQCTMFEPSVVLEPEDIDVDESSTDVLEIFAVTGGDKKRVEVNERKMTDEDRKLFRRAKEAEFQSWLDHKVFDVGKPRHASVSWDSRPDEQESCQQRSSD